MGVFEYKKQIDKVCLNHKDKLVFRCLDENEINITYDDLYKKILSFKEVLDKLQIYKGDRIALVSGDTYQEIICFLCLSYWNITSIIIDSTYSKEQLKEMISMVDVKYIISDKENYSKMSDFDIPIIDINDNKKLVDGTTKEYENKNEENVVILFSSGTTDSIKPVMIGYEGLHESIINNIKVANLNDNDVYLDYFPINHVSGLESTLSFFMVGATICFSKKSILDINKTIHYFNPSVFGMTPKVFEIMLNKLEENVDSRLYYFCRNVSRFLQQNFHFKKIAYFFTKKYKEAIFGNNIRFLFTGSIKSKDKVIHTINDLGLGIINIYASTECGCPICQNYPEERYLENSVGNINNYENITIKINNPDLDGIGEIIVKTKSIMLGYYNDPKKTKESFVDDYYLTGDLGYIDSNNYLHIVGKIKETIQLENGEKIAPFDLETQIEDGCPRNNKAVVCGINNGSYDDIHIFIKDLGYNDIDKQEIKNKLTAYIKSKSINYPIKKIHFVSDIPITKTQKIKRDYLIQMVSNEKKEKYSYNDEKLQFIMDNIHQLVDIEDPIDTNIRLIDLGLDSLSILSISTNIYNKYKINIVEHLSTNSTIKDIIKLLNNETKDVNLDKKILRKIKIEEVKEIAMIKAECLEKYSLYDAFFKDKKNRKMRIFYTCWFKTFQARDYTYVNDDKSIVLSIKKPTDKDTPVWKLIFNLDLFFGFIFHEPLYIYSRLISYGKMADALKKKYYNPSRDIYAVAACVSEEARSSGLFFKAIRELDDNGSIYTETQTVNNVKLYEKLGFKVCESSSWNGITHYGLRRD